MIYSPLLFFGGIIFGFVGFVMMKFPPKKINSLYGYRTISSMKTQERWDFAQKISAKMMVKLGGLLATSSLLALVTNFNKGFNLILGISLMITIVIVLLVRVETAIKRKFGN